MTEPEGEIVLPSFAVLLNEAQEIVRGKAVWRKFIDGTPLSNDIAVWMAEFAMRWNHRPPAAPDHAAIVEKCAKAARKWLEDDGWDESALKVEAAIRALKGGAA